MKKCTSAWIEERAISILVPEQGWKGTPVSPNLSVHLKIRLLFLAFRTRLTLTFELANPENLTNKNTLSLGFVDWTGTATIVNADGDLNQFFFDDSCYTSSDDHLRVESVSLNGNTLTINWQGKGGGTAGSSSYSRKFRVASKNGLNGGVVKSSNELTIEVKYSG